MNQSTIIFGFLAAAFLIFITQRGELPIYWGFLVSYPVSPSSGPAATGSGSLTDSSSKMSEMNATNANNFKQAVNAFETIAAFA